jgi:hypothetical protein
MTPLRDRNPPWDWLSVKMCARYGHLVRRVEPGAPDGNWIWWCPRCYEDLT